MNSTPLETVVGIVLVGAGLLVAALAGLAVIAYAVTHAPFDDPTEE